MKNLTETDKKVGKKRGSIRNQIIRSGALPVLIGFVVIFILVLTNVHSALEQRIEEELEIATDSVAEQVDEYFEKFDHITDVMAQNEQFMNMTKALVPGNKDVKKLPDFKEAFQSLVSIHKSDSNIVAVWVADIDTSQLWASDGYFTAPDWDVTSREWYKSIQANPNANFIMSKPYLYEFINQKIVSIVTPMRDENGTLLGVAGIDVTITKVSEFMAQTKLGETGYYTLVTNTGDIMYHPDEKLIDTQIQDAPLSEKLKKLIADKKEDLLHYKEDGVKLLGSNKVAKTTNWHIISAITEKEIYQDYFSLRTGMLIVFIIVLAVSLLALWFSSKLISQSLVELNKAAEQIANGDLDVHLDVRANNEVGMVSESMNKTVSRLNEYIDYIDEIAKVLVQMASGDMRIRLTKDYKGEFQIIKTALENISASLNHTLGLINDSSEQVNQGAIHVSSSAQALATGATEQASSLEELTASAVEISTQSKENAENAENSKNLALRAGAELQEVVSHMSKMLSAMEDISNSSEEIHKIIKVIDDIAFQTNILALNASVEAARAGEAGKGFAVVADEVRNLAVKSAEAAKQTQVLVEESVRNANIGFEISKETSVSIERVGEIAQQSTQILEIIAEASKVQSQTIERMNVSLGQISTVVQSNAATAEQSSAASEELSAQATMLYEEVKKFKLENTNSMSNNFDTPTFSNQEFSAPASFENSGDKY